MRGSDSPTLAASSSNGWTEGAQWIPGLRARSETSGPSAQSNGTLDAYRVARYAGRFQPYSSRVRPTPFLDDITTKNVLVHAGRLSGIVDVDWVCFGDSLFTVALTRASLLGSGAHPEYTDHWCKVLDLTEEQHRVVRFYTALFCVDFMSEFGQRFSQGVKRLDLERLGRLEKILNDFLCDAG